ncbi:hypothetical protein ACLQ3C_06270 [Gordonia sp. DT30]|uniref:hypothetical protein n=1 Tax=unclassified Gordonia (in: high G+C Gram-positive bacteria) TaxID=2657482 RepID=UPI003CEC0E82
MMTRTGWIWSAVICVAVIIVVVVAVGVATYFSTGHPAARMADRIGVSIPADATRVGVDDPPFALQGNCSVLEFLIPTTQWRDYAGRYFELNALDGPHMLWPPCGRTRIMCDNDIYIKGYDASGQGKGVTRRLQVTPDCVDGQARITWGTTD